MFEAFVITLREGVEAALVLSIAVSLLRRRGLGRLTRPLAAGAACALAGSVAVAILASRISYNEELAEGLAMLIGAGLVLSLTWWMWKAAPHMSQEIEGGLERATRGGSGSLGVFLLAFALVLREGVETAIFLSAAEFNSRAHLPGSRSRWCSRCCSCAARCASRSSRSSRSPRRCCC
jgi:FTR1 family protein